VLTPSLVLRGGDDADIKKVTQKVDAEKTNLRVTIVYGFFLHVLQTRHLRDYKQSEYTNFVSLLLLMYHRKPPRRAPTTSTPASAMVEQYLNEITPGKLKSIGYDKLKCLTDCKDMLETAKNILNQSTSDERLSTQEQIDDKLNILKEHIIKSVDSIMEQVTETLENNSRDDEERAKKIMKKSREDSDVHHHVPTAPRNGKSILVTSKFFYSGHFENDKPHGSGLKRYKDAEGNDVGNFKHGLRDGEGTLVDSREKDNVLRFEGTFVNNKFVKGKVITKSEEYEGSLLNELYDGKGTLRTKMDDGDIHEYVGTFKEGVLVGNGTLRALRGDEELVMIEGPIENHHFNGICKVVLPFMEYFGKLVNSEYHGKGTMTYTGFTYRQQKCIAIGKGNWTNNMRNGKHVMKAYIAEGYDSSSRPVMEIESIFEKDVMKGIAKVRHYSIPNDNDIHMKRILESEYIGPLSSEYLYDGKGVNTHKKYIYDGNYCYNLRHGKGKYTDVASGMVIEGDFDDNFLDGRCVTVIYASGDVYEGQIKQDWHTHEFPEEEYLASITRNGPGVLTYNDLTYNDKKVSAVWEDDYVRIDGMMNLMIERLGLKERERKKWYEL